jgi:uncharacterized protein YkwD
VKWLIALLLAASCPAPPAAPVAPQQPAPTGPPGEVIGQNDPDDPDDPGFDPDEPDFDRSPPDEFGDDPEPHQSPPRPPSRGDDDDDQPEPPPPTNGDDDDGDDDDDEPAPARPPRPVSKDPEPPGPLRGILAAHNKVRAQHCAAPLKWSAKVAAVAQRWADTLAARNCAFEHSRGNKYGENLAFASPAGTHSSASATQGWYREVSLYDFNNPRFSFEAGHFTQVVWRGSTTLGCGYATCGDGRAELWVCNYDPPGNVSRAFSANVLPSSCRSR